MVASGRSSRGFGMADSTLDWSSPVGRWVRRTVLTHWNVPRDVRVVRSRLPASHRTVRCSIRVGDSELGAFVLKEYFRDSGISPREAGIRARREIHAFRVVGAAGLTQGTGRVAKLLAGRTSPPAALAIEFVEGVPLDLLLKRAASEGSEGAASAAENALAHSAGLLARFHAVPDPGIPIWRSRLARYPFSLLHTLAAEEVISERQFRALAAQLERFREILADLAPCLVHGDANPTNFLILPDGGVVATDLERTGSCDPALDLGFLAADVLHLTRQYGGSPPLADRLISALHAGYLSQGGSASGPLRAGLFLAIGLWRIARNSWLPARHRKWLVVASRRALAGARADISDSH